MNGQALKFYQEIIKLSNKDKEEFIKIVNKLLRVNYIAAKKDIRDYNFISQNYEALKAYFVFMDCGLVIDNNLQVIVLYNKRSNNFNLRINESIILLILRLLYEEKKKELNLTNEIIITLNDIHEHFMQTGLRNRRISNTEMRQILNLFCRFNLIDVLDRNYRNDNSRVILYPTLLYAVNINDINQLYDILSTYNK